MPPLANYRSRPDPFDRKSPENYSIKSKAVLPVTWQNDEKVLSKARNELRRQEFFHKDYDPKLDEPT